MTEYAMTYAELHIFCMLLLGVILIRMVKSVDKQIAQIWYMRTCLMHIVFLAVSMCRGLYRCTYVRTGMGAYILEALYGVTLLWAVFLWVYHMEITANPALLEKKDHLRNLSIPFAVMTVLVLSSQWTHISFYLTDQGELRMTSGYYFLAMMTCVVAINAALIALFNLHYEGNKDQTIRVITNMVYALVLSVSIGISHSLNMSRRGPAFEIPLVGIGTTLVLVNIYINYVSQQISTDPLTQINNRNLLISYIEKKIELGARGLYLIMMDVDRFKGINDRYGHVEGDAALVRVSDSIRQSCVDLKNRPFISRYGGDEFIVVLEAESRTDVDLLCSRISRTLIYNGTWSKSPYTLRVSFGVAAFREGLEKPQDFIKCADEALYEAKKNRK